MLDVVVPGIPVAWQRTGQQVLTDRLGNPRRHAVTGRVLQKHFRRPKSDAWREEAQLRMTQAAVAQGRITRGPILLQVVGVWPGRWNDWRWKDTLPDQDNLAKLIQDSANGILWKDDGQVALAVVWCLWCPSAVRRSAPRVMIRCAPLPVPDRSTLRYANVTLAAPLSNLILGREPSWEPPGVVELEALRAVV